MAANPTKVLTGARAVVSVNNAIVGVFESCNYSTSIGTEPIFLLGRYSADEITPTSYEIANLTCSGFRVVGAGPYTGSPSANNPGGLAGGAAAGAAGPTMYMLQDLINLEGVTITIVDRQTKQNILIVNNCVATGHNGNHNSRATSRITINYVGTVMSDESGAQQESAGATQLP